MIFKDFIGNRITEGCFCAYPGAGNVKAEYGQILYYIVGFDYEKNKIKAIRLFADYAQGEMRNLFPPSHTKNAMITDVEIPDHYRRNNGKPIPGKIAVRYHQSSLENTNKLAIVNPSEKIKRIFSKILNSDASVFEEITGEQIAHWIHGGNVKNPFAE